MLLRIIREIWVSSDWFGCVFVISFYFAKVFSKSVTQSSPCFTIVWLFAISLSYAVDDIDGGEIKWSVILMNLLGQDTFLRYEWEKKFGSWASTFEIKKDPCWSWKSSSSRLELSLSWMVVFHYLPLVFPPKTLRIQLESLGYLLLIFALFIRHFSFSLFQIFL